MVNITAFYWTGHANQYLAPLKRSIAQICRSDRPVQKYYIGIASGSRFEQGLRRRIDLRKLEWGVSDIWMIYQSRSRRSVTWLERELVEYFKDDDRLMNAVGGGGGRPADQPYYFLYLAQFRTALRPNVKIPDLVEELKRER